jgi:hypothetical protein
MAARKDGILKLIVMKYFNTDKSFWERSRTFYTNQIERLKTQLATPNVTYLIEENTKELERVNNLLKNSYGK